MLKPIIIASALAAVACSKKTPVPTVPSSALSPDTAEERPLNKTKPTGETMEVTPVVPEEAAEPPPEVVVEAPTPVTPSDTLFLDPGADELVAAEQVIAVIAPTRGNKVRGTITLRETNEGLELTADVAGLAKGPHAFHIHMFGDCSAPDATSAGDHFHFTGSSLEPKEHMITGDLGELTADKAGKATATRIVAGATLHGKFSILGRSVVIHENGNDATHPPDGAAGKRLGCGVIGVRQASPEPPINRATGRAPARSRSAR